MVQTQPQMNFSNKIKELIGVASRFVDDYGAALPAGDATWRAVSYAISSPGKRFRPMLALASAELLGLEPALVQPFATALEIIHASTLVHDDLPILDNSPLRRGVPTTHIEFGPGVALLAADAMIGEGIRLVLRTDAPAERRIALAELLSETFVKICEGQVLDLHAERDESGLDFEEGKRRLEARHLLKTGALITAAVAGPALLIEEEAARERAFFALSNYGRELGLLFQITDDLLDATASTEQIGKTTGIDSREGRITYVTLFGEDGARLEAAQRAATAMSALEPFNEHGWFLGELAAFVLDRKK